MQTIDEEKQTSLLDILLVMAENIKLLVLGPLVIGAMAWLTGFALPQSFTSQAILATVPAQAASIMTSPLVLDPVITSLTWSNGITMERARAKLLSQVKATIGKDALLRLDVSANKPEDAQKIANLIIGSYLKSTEPGALDRADLEKRLGNAKASLSSIQKLMERITSVGSNVLNKPTTLGETGTSLVALGELQARYLGEVLTIPRALQGLSRDTVIQPPTLPAEPTSPKKGLLALLSAMGSGLVLLLWVFMRQAWTNNQQDPEVAAKQARLLAALRFKKRSL